MQRPHCTSHAPLGLRPHAPPAPPPPCSGGRPGALHNHHVPPCALCRSHLCCSCWGLSSGLLVSRSRRYPPWSLPSWPAMLNTLCPTTWVHWSAWTTPGPGWPSGERSRGGYTSGHQASGPRKAFDLEASSLLPRQYSDKLLPPRRALSPSAGFLNPVGLEQTSEARVLPRDTHPSFRHPTCPGYSQAS